MKSFIITPFSPYMFFMGVKELGSEGGVSELLSSDYAALRHAYRGE